MIRLCYVFAIIIGNFFNVHSQDIDRNFGDEKSRKLKIDKIKEIDFLSYKYKNLDENFKIKIDSSTFNSIVKKFGFYEERINAYNDSLRVVLTGEFEDSDYTRIAQLRITYTWKRVSYYLWESAENLQKIAKKHNIKYPYYFQACVEQSNCPNKEILKLVENLRTKLILKFGAETINALQTNKELLNFAFKNNPAVQQLKEDIMQKRRR
jgi:hypothetical protein